MPTLRPAHRFIRALFCLLLLPSLAATAADTDGDGVPDQLIDEGFEGGVNAPWSTSGSTAWWQSPNDFHGGSYAAGVDGVLGEDLVLSREVTLTAPGTLTFWARSIIDNADNSLRFTLDGVEQWHWYWTYNWEMVRIAIPAGTHTLAWINRKNVDGTAATTWVDDIFLGDNCPLVANGDQLDSDSDDLGDACDDDDDSDGVLDLDDAFPLDPNESVDTDGDGIGDNGDEDADNDGLPYWQEDEIGSDRLRADTDGDGLIDGSDNCPVIANPDQANGNGTPTGDACERRLYVNALAYGNNDGTSWDNAYNSLAEALNVARAGDDIWVAQGIYSPDTNLAWSFPIRYGVQLWGGFAGNEEALEQRDWRRNPTVLSGDLDQNDIDPEGDGIIANWADIQGSNTPRVVSIGSANEYTRLDGFVITGGDGEYWGADGGGIYMDAGSPRLSNLILSGNRAFLGGGFISYDGAPRLENVLITGNYATAAGAGAFLYGGGGTLVNLTAVGNSAYDDGIGGLAFVSSGPSTLTNSILWGNQGANIRGNAGVSHSIVGWCGNSGVEWLADCGTDEGHNRDADPLFVDAEGGDLRIASIHSPAIDSGDAGAVAGLAKDLQGNPRIQNAGVDRGAYESNWAAMTTAPALSGTTGDDLLTAQRANTSLNAGAGDDILHSGPGRQVITLGPGHDLLVWAYYPDSDVVNDFSLSRDRLDVRSLLAGYGLGYSSGDPLLSGHFSCTAGAGGVSLRFDRDGTGSAYSPVNYALVKGGEMTPANLCRPGNFLFTP